MNHPHLLPAGRTGAYLTDIRPQEWIPLPDGASLVWLPGTRAVGVHPETGEITDAGPQAYAVGALLPQGFTRLLLPGYVKRPGAEPLPLFGYTAVGWYEDRFYVAADATDDPALWDPSAVPEADVEQAVRETLRAHPDNRLFEHLSHCALTYGCMTAKNTFLGRQEAALPVSSACNAGCVGCISEQPEDAPFPSPQVRLDFRPSVDELVDVMLTHIRRNPRGIVSFGQGCEGEPSTRWMDMVRAIRAVRERTADGYINVNTNGGLTKPLQAVVDAGLDLMRVSIISALEDHYNAYYRPRGYTLKDVAATLRYAADQGVYTSINYLVFPGVTDREEEIEAMVDFLRRTGVRLVQMRNLNIDPEYYLERIPPQRGELYGMRTVMDIFREEIPGIEIGSYSHVPPENWKRRA
ncbi:radical SAM protein [Alicyclobacillus sp.]|uniref:radical SAM protein n=1 Tax=Alicyclobacillus sp. TaxID=61169 RepID=UPI0025C23EC7|nr:radical SAM protein [Alicyclobacillus sp.]MCL6515855.1 radical SAM protein [Alicyclobacillus sp.]